jgi:hypothetical protein
MWRKMMVRRTPLPGFGRQCPRQELGVEGAWSWSAPYGPNGRHRAGSAVAVDGEQRGGACAGAEKSRAMWRRKGEGRKPSTAQARPDKVHPSMGSDNDQRWLALAFSPPWAWSPCGDWVGGERHRSGDCRERLEPAGPLTGGPGPVKNIISNFQFSSNL